MLSQAPEAAQLLQEPSPWLSSASVPRLRCFHLPEHRPEHLHSLNMKATKQPGTVGQEGAALPGEWQHSSVL